MLPAVAVVPTAAVDFRLTVMAHPETDLEVVVRLLQNPGPPGGGGPGGGGGGGPPDGGLDGPDTFQCERCTGTFPTHLRRLCVSCKFSCCNDCCRDPLRVCVVCPERQTGNPSGQAIPGPEPQGEMGLLAMQRRRSASLSASSPSQSPLSSEDGLSR